MKKLVALLLALLLVCCSWALAEEAPHGITIRSWMDSQGADQGAVMVQVQEVINPVLAVVADETGCVNLFGVTIDGRFTDFYTANIKAGDILLLWNPVYHLYEDTIEMADTVLIRHISWEGNSESENTVTSQYEFTASPDEELCISDAVFDGEVHIYGEGQPVRFVNCEFHRNVISHAPSTTFVWIMPDCQFADGAHCIIESGVREADMDYSIPKFCVFSPVEVECKDLGGVIACGDFDIVFDGKTYAIADVEYVETEDGQIIPYEEGMEISVHVAMHWWENGEEVLFTLGAN